MKKLTQKDIENPLFGDALWNVIQRGIRDIKEQDDGKTEKTIKDLKKQRVLMEKLQYALFFNRVEIEIKIK